MFDYYAENEGFELNCTEKEVADFNLWFVERKKLTLSEYEKLRYRSDAPIEDAKKAISVLKKWRLELLNQ